MNEERRIERTAEKLIKLWPVAAVIMAGISGWLKLKWDVDDLQKNQEQWQSESGLRREKNHEEIDAIKTRITIIETKMALAENRSGPDRENGIPR